MSKIDNTKLNIIKQEYKTKGLNILAKELGVNPKTIYRYGKKLGLNKKRGLTVKLNCPVCKKDFTRTHYYLNRYIGFKKHKNPFCSRKCLESVPNINSNMLKAFKLFEEGKKYKEIAEIMNKPMGTIANWLNKVKHRSKRIDGTSVITIRKKLRSLYKKCMICDFDRALEIAHIVPASKGGLLIEENTLGLCPNHHFLFDQNKLLEIEAEKLKSKVPNYNERCIKNV